MKMANLLQGWVLVPSAEERLTGTKTSRRAALPEGALVAKGVVGAVFFESLLKRLFQV
jgi:hypothetical protein